LPLALRAAFLSCATVTDPQKGYHAAFVLSYGQNAHLLQCVLQENGIESKRGMIKGKECVYLKESGKIEDLLSLIGAEKYSLFLMDQKIERSIRGNINRRQNFDGANLKKTVEGSQGVILAIHYLEKIAMLEHLPEPLQHAAKLRLSYPEVSLKELCERSEEELTKSGLNHRLQKLVKLAEKMKKEEENHE
jgi:DNA-binding protein WhiA